MKIIKAQQKTFLHNLFYSKNQMGQFQEKRFPLDQIMTASSTLKKIKDGSEVIEDNGKVLGIRFLDSEVEFSADEWKILKQLFSSNDSVAVSEADVFAELKEIFN